MQEPKYYEIRRMNYESGKFFYFNEEENKDKLNKNIYFLSKKYPETYYNAEVYSTFKRKLYDIKYAIFTAIVDKKNDKMENEYCSLPKIKEQKNTSYQFCHDCEDGIGLRIVILSDKEEVSDSEITKAIENFWDNEEKPIKPTY